MDTPTKPHFGTDGIRGLFGSEITLEMATELGKCMGIYSAKNNCPLWIGKDTRTHSDALQDALLDGIHLVGANATVANTTTSGVLGWLVYKYGGLGVMITASHNGPKYNGLKFLGATGKLSDTEIDAVLSSWGRLDIEPKSTPTSTKGSGHLGTNTAVNQVTEHIAEQIEATVGLTVPLKGLSLAVDGGEGGGSIFAPALLERLGADVHRLHCNANGERINVDCGTNSPQTLADYLSKASGGQDAQLGLALDGDGDRLIIVNKSQSGNIQILDGDDLLHLHALHNPHAAKGIAGTDMTNSGLEQSLTKLGIPFARSRVGEKHLINLMRENDWSIGGESSGHIIDLQLLPTCDGTIGAATLLARLLKLGRESNTSVTEIILSSAFERYDSLLTNIPISADSAEFTTLKNSVAKMQNELDPDAARFLLRPSGTEPVVRLLVETHEHGRATTITNTLTSDLIP